MQPVAYTRQTGTAQSLHRPNSICTRYNSTLYSCVRADGKLKGVGEQYFNNEQCISNLCNGVCYMN